MLARTLLILAVLVQQLCLPVVLFAAPERCADTACCGRVETTTCCGERTAESVCHMTGGTCLCGIESGDIPVAPAPGEDRVEVTTLAAMPAGLAARLLGAERPDAAAPLEASPARTHNEVQALLGVWRK